MGPAPTHALPPGCAGGRPVGDTGLSTMHIKYPGPSRADQGEPMTSYLVTGGTGLIGSNVCRLLVEQGDHGAGPRAARQRVRAS